MLSGFKKDFVYEEKYLKGAEFNVYAAENIYTPDYQKDENGNRQLIYAKDASGNNGNDRGRRKSSCR